MANTSEVLRRVASIERHLPIGERITKDDLRWLFATIRTALKDTERVDGLMEGKWLASDLDGNLIQNREQLDEFLARYPLARRSPTTGTKE